MEQEIKIIKRLLLYGIALFLLAVLINVNIERSVICINSPILSNNLLLTLIGGVCTGITAVVIEKLYKYHLDKITMINMMYVSITLLYAEIYYWICNIDELLENKNEVLPENLFSNKLPQMQYYVNSIKNMGYCSFLRNDPMQSV